MSNPEQPLQLSLASLSDTDRLGALLANACEAPLVICLQGTLGAGKTRLVQAFAAAAGVPAGTVVSPTFVLCQHYHGSFTIHHLDAYRIRDGDEFLELGVDELFDSPAITFVEWADRVSACLPRDRLEVTIQTGETGEQRLVEVQATGSHSAQVLARLAESSLSSGISQNP